MSLAVKCLSFKSFTASSLLSSACSTALNRASFPPAIKASMTVESALKVGRHSTASSIPSLPEVPQPQYMSLPPPLIASVMRSTPFTMFGISFSTARATFASSPFISLIIPSVLSSSMCIVSGFLCSV